MLESFDLLVEISLAAISTYYFASFRFVASHVGHFYYCDCEDEIETNEKCAIIKNKSFFWLQISLLVFSTRLKRTTRSFSY